MNQTYKATLSPYALPQSLPIWGDLEGCSLKTMMFEKYPSISPYTYCANNPVIMIDPDGKKVFAYDKATKKFMKSYFKEQFGSSNMFKFNSENELKIRNRNFNKALDRANENQTKLLKGMERAINVNDKALVQITEKSNGQMSFSVNENCFPSTMPDPAGSGGGGTGYSGNYGGYLVAISNMDAQNDDLSTSYMKKIGKDDLVSTKTGKNAGAVFFHEVLDEFLNFFSAEKNVNSNSPQIDKVQFQNAALENIGKPPRDGLDHQ